MIKIATLKTDFSDGDILFSGITTDTDKLNGIAERINAHTHAGTNTPNIPLTSVTNVEDNLFFDTRLLAALYWEADYADEVPLKTLYKNELTGFGMDFENLDSISNYDEASSTNCKYFTDGSAVCCNILDNFNDNSIDANIWTTNATGDAAVTEGGEELRINMVSGGENSTAYARTNGTVGYDCKTADGTIIMYLPTISDSNTAHCDEKLRIYDGSSSVDVIAEFKNFNAKILELYFDTSGETVKYRSKAGHNAEWSSWSGAVDLASLGSSWYLEFYINYAHVAGAEDIRLEVDIIGYVKGAVTSTFLSNKEDIDTKKDSNTTSEAMTVLGYYDELGTATVQCAISANNGGAYTNATIGEWTSGLTAGADVIAKATVVTNATKPVYIKEYFVAWKDD